MMPVTLITTEKILKSLLMNCLDGMRISKDPSEYVMKMSHDLRIRKVNKLLQDWRQVSVVFLKKVLRSTRRQCNIRQIWRFCFQVSGIEKPDFRSSLRSVLSCPEGSNGRRSEMKICMLLEMLVFIDASWKCTNNSGSYYRGRKGSHLVMICLNK